MKAEKLKSGNYRVQKMINGKRYNFSFDHKPTKKEIEDKIAEIRLGIVTQNNAPNSDFNTCALSYIDSKSNVISAATIRGYKSIVRNTPQWFLDIVLKDIDTVTVQNVVNEYAATHSPKSTRNFHGFIASVLGMYVPGLSINTTLPQKEEKDVYIPTREEVDKILNAVDGTRYYIPLKLACYGLRRSEVLALVYPDDFEGNFVAINKAKVLDSENNMIVKSTKTTKSAREIHIDDDLLTRIKEQGYIYDGYPDKINERLQIEQKRLGIKKFTLHKLRHYYATEISKVLPEQDWLKSGGWSTPHVAKSIYRHEQISRDREMQKRVSETLFD